MNDDPLVTIQHVRDSGICVAGARKWFNRHGLDFGDFIRNGIRASVLLRSGDGYARQVVDRLNRGKG